MKTGFTGQTTDSRPRVKNVYEPRASSGATKLESEKTNKQHTYKEGTKEPSKKRPK